MKKLLQFGAGNIGRSFIGALFAGSGWQVTFVDVDRTVIDALHHQRGYPVVIKHPDGVDERIEITGVDAIDAADREAVIAAVNEADLISTSVGKQALTGVLQTIAAGLEQRNRVVDIILAENLRDGARFARTVLRERLGAESEVLDRTGLVETSIGKMVPLMSAADRSHDPLQVFAEPYNTLILDRHGFVGATPDMANIQLVDSIAAYVDRKLFIHNMGHAAAAYLGFQHDPRLTLLPQVIAVPRIRATVRAAMLESAGALGAAYPDDLDPEALERHIDDLLTRFGNLALGDTVYRVGRDLRRKLHKSDRMLGAMLLAERMSVPCDSILEATVAALGFRATDETGAMFGPDRSFHRDDVPRGVEYLLSDVCGLSDADPAEHRVAARLRKALYATI